MKQEFNFEFVLSKLYEIIKKNNLKQTKRRECVLKALYNSDKHLSPEEILNEIRKSGDSTSIGIATIYRILALLEKEKLLKSITINQNNSKKYELNLGKHHDHIICFQCGKIIEFYNEKLEKLQEDIAKQQNFKLINHTLKLYGYCNDCLIKGK